MADNDAYELQVVGEQQGVAIGNSFYLRANADGPLGTELDTLLDMLETEIVPKIALFTSIGVTFTCIGVRRVTGITTALKTRFVNIAGVMPGDALPTTVYVKMRAYTIPYQARQSLGNKFSGVPESEVQDGQLNLAHVLRFADLINYLLTNPITFGGNSYNWCSSRAYVNEDPTYVNVGKANIVPCVFSIRQRQSNLCGS